MLISRYYVNFKKFILLNVKMTAKTLLILRIFFAKNMHNRRGCFSVAFSCKCSAVNGIIFFCDLACMRYFDFRGNNFKIFYRTNFAIVCILRKWKHAFHFNPTLIDDHKSRIKY